MSLLKTLCFVITIVCTTIITIVIIRTIALKTRQHDVPPCAPSDLDFIDVGMGTERLKRFREALRFQTVSKEPGEYNRRELDRFVKYILSGMHCYFAYIYLHKEITSNTIVSW